MRLCVGFLAAMAACAQGTTPKPAAAEYPVHAEANGVGIGADFMVHSFGTGDQMYVVENYLVVEVALYPPKGATITAEPARFVLRVNGKKVPLTPQPPTMVAASLRHREWQPGPTADMGGGPAGVGSGYPTNRAPFPGAPQQQPRLPAPPRAPDAGPPGGVERNEAASPADVVTQTALPEDPHRGSISGFLYFPFRAKTSSIKSLELEWEGAVLKLR